MIFEDFEKTLSAEESILLKKADRCCSSCYGWVLRKSLPQDMKSWETGAESLGFHFILYEDGTLIGHDIQRGIEVHRFLE